MEHTTCPGSACDAKVTYGTSGVTNADGTLHTCGGK